MGVALRPGRPGRARAARRRGTAPAGRLPPPAPPCPAPDRPPAASRLSARPQRNASQGEAAQRSQSSPRDARERTLPPWPQPLGVRRGPWSSAPGSGAGVNVMRSPCAPSSSAKCSGTVRRRASGPRRRSLAPNPDPYPRVLK